MAVKIYSLYGERPPKVGQRFVKPSLTQQHFKDECDVNRIMKRYEETGSWGEQQTNVRPQFGDFSTEFDFRQAQETVIRAAEAFDALPARVRKRFNNDPAELLDFLGDEKNREEAIFLGLIEKPQKTAPVAGEPASGGESGQETT